MRSGAVRSDRGTARPGPVGVALIVLAAASVAAAVRLSLSTAGGPPGEGGLSWLVRFLARALRPALTHEARFVPEGTPPLLALSAAAVGRTVLYASAAMSMALPAGLVLGILSSAACWRDLWGERGGPPRALRTLRLFVRGVSASARSLHEIGWALLLLSVFGRSELCAVAAVAVPYAGFLGRVFADLLDQGRAPFAEAIRSTGAPPIVVFALGRGIPALSDLVGYAFYRLECAVRSSAVLGFFGFATIGQEVRQSFRAGAYGEVWTHVWLVLGAMALLESWSAAVRRRLTS